MSPSALIEFTPHSAMPTDGVASGDGRSNPDDVPMCIDSGRPVSAAAANTGSQWPDGNDGRPIGYGFSTKLTAFDPFAAQRSISRAASCGSHNGISDLRDEPVGVGRAPLVEHPVVPGLDARERELFVVGFEEPVPAEARERREQQLGPHAVFVHGAYAFVDVVRARDHVLVAAREEIVALAGLARRGTSVCSRCPGTTARRTALPTPIPALAAPARRSAVRGRGTLARCDRRTCAPARSRGRRRR